MEVVRGAQVRGQHLGGGAHRLEAFHHPGERLVAGLLGGVGMLLGLGLRGLGDDLLVVADFEVHLHLRVREMAVLRRIVLIVGDLLHEIGRAALLEIVRDGGLVHRFLGAASGENDGNAQHCGENSTHFSSK